MINSFLFRATCYHAAYQEKRMKRLFPLIALALLLIAPVFARATEDEALINEDDTWNMYTRLGLSFSEVGQDDAFWGNLEVGGILNNQLALGLRFNTLGQETDPGFNGYNNPDKFDLWYGGLAVEYTAWANKIFHASLAFFIGGGQLRLEPTPSGNDEDEQIFVMEPSLNIMINVTPRSELGLGLGYRDTDTYDSDINGLDDGSLSGLVGTLFLRLTND